MRYSLAEKQGDIKQGNVKQGDVKQVKFKQSVPTLAESRNSDTKTPWLSEFRWSALKQFQSQSTFFSFNYFLLSCSSYY